MIRHVWLLTLALSAIWPAFAHAQKTPAEIQAYCHRAGNTNAAEDRLYPAQFPTEWRCMDGSVYTCDVGATGRQCSHAGFTFAPGKGELAYCRENPNSDFIPGAWLSSGAISWRCHGGKPLIVETEGLDEQGYIKRAWKKVEPK